MVSLLRQKIWADFFSWVIALSCAACSSTYEAPVLDQGERLVVNAPIVVNSGDPASKFFIEKRSQQN